MSRNFDDEPAEEASGHSTEDACPFTRRDFLSGVAVTVGTGMLSEPLHAKSDRTPLPVVDPAGQSIAIPPPPLGKGPDPTSTEALLAQGITQDDPRYYPPVLTGMRGSHPGSFEVVHAVRNGAFHATPHPGKKDPETYDLVVVGGGISGLSAAYFYRQRAQKPARILILDNHDDFGGHAKRNELHIDGRMLLMNGGTLGISSPTPYSPVADGLLRELGVDPPALSKKCNDRELYPSLGLKPAVFFDKETFGADRLVTGAPGGRRGRGGRADAKALAAFLARTPLEPKAQRDIVRLETAEVDYMPGLTSAEKKDKLWRISYKDFLLKLVKVDPSVVAYYQRRTEGEWGVGIDAQSALDMWAFGMPGFQGMKLEPGVTPRMSYTAAGYYLGGSYTFHYPDGNASIARLLVRSLIPGVAPGHTAEDIVTAKFDYPQLDRPESPVRIRLNSPVVHVEHVGGKPGDPGSATAVEVTYAYGGKTHKVRGRTVVLACYNVAIPYLCPEIPAPQKEALDYLVKVPLVYTTVALRNWRAFHKLGIADVSCPGCYFHNVSLNPVVNIGDYKSPASPDEPTLLRLTRTPNQPGVSAREQQIAGRFELFGTPLSTFERKVHEQLGRILRPGGFDPARDIAAIVVNRWPHGYAYEYNCLFDPEWPTEKRPDVRGRQPYGRIAIANSDAGATAYTDVAIDQAYRAVADLMTGLRGAD